MKGVAISCSFCFYKQFPPVNWKSHFVKLLSVTFATLIMGVLIPGCKGVFNKSSSGGPVESYYRGEGKMVYFIKPVTFSNSEKQKMFIDFTYDHDNDTVRPVVCNYSIYSEEPYRKVEDVSIALDDAAIPTDSLKKFFVERGKKKKKLWHNRYSFQVAYENFQKFVRHDDPAIKIKSSRGEETFKVDKLNKWPKMQETIENRVIIPAELMKDD